MPAALQAQPLVNVESGSRVRLKIDSNPSWLVGVYQECRADSLSILFSGEPESRLIKLADITEAEVSHGRFRQVRKSALVGAAIGAGVGVVAGIFGTGDSQIGDITPGEYLTVVAITAGAGAATGVLSRVVIGIVTGESWTPVSPKGAAAKERITSLGFR